MYAKMIQITPAIHLYRERLLPTSGSVVARVSQKVTPNDVVAEASLPSRHLLIDVARAFGMANVQAAEELIKRKVGETIAENDLLAETGGVFSRMIRSKAAGKIVSISNGQILIETRSETINLKANYAGTIQKILPNHGVIIETNCALIQGAWGNNKLVSGNMVCKSMSQSGEIEVNSLDVNTRGAILVGGTCLEEKTLDLAASLPVAGMILGTIPAALREQALKQTYPILLTDGFGKNGMNESAWRLLSANNGHEITLNATFNEDGNENSPEILIALSEQAAEAATASRLTRGQLVRIHTAPFQGKTGVIEKVLPGLTSLGNGLRVCAASVIVDNKERNIIPIANLDVIGFAS